MISCKYINFLFKIKIFRLFVLFSPSCICFTRCPNSGDMIFKPVLTAFGEPGIEIINVPL